MKWMQYSVIFILCSLMTISLFSAPVKASPDVSGPRLDELGVYFYESEEECYGALKTGEIDYMVWSLTTEQVVDAREDSNIVLGRQEELYMREFDINNNYTLSACRPDHRNPCNDIWMRKAIAHCVNKTYIVREILGGYGYRMDVPLLESQKSWWNPNVTGENYPYLYDLDEARNILDQHGWNDSDADGTRNYPANWPGKTDRPNLDPLIFYIRSDDPERMAAGDHLAYNLEEIGIPVEAHHNESAVCMWAAIYERSYHIYTGAWGMGRLPLIYFLYHSEWWTPIGTRSYNYVTGMNESNLPNYPDLDAALLEVYYGAELDAIKDAVKLSQQLLVDNAVMIPLWSPISYQAWRKELLGVINMPAYGPENIYTFMNAYHQNPDETEFKIGIPRKPNRYNAVYWVGYEFKCVSRIIDRSYESYGTTMLPYDIMKEQPWMIEDWEVSTWDGGTKTKQTIWFSENITFVKPVSGDHVCNLTANDFFFTIWLLNSFEYGSGWRSTMYIDHMVILDDDCVEIYYSDLSLWLTIPTGNFPGFLPKAAWDREDGFVGYNGRVYSDWPITDRLSESYSVGGLELPETPGLLDTIREPVWVENVTADGVPLEPFTEWNIVQRNGRPYIYIYADLPYDAVISLNYSVAANVSGKYPGECDWQDILVGNGMWYVTEITEDWFKCKANREYFKKAPLIITVETPVEDKIAVIEGNVTLSAANTTYNTIHLNATGPTGSTGWINLTFPAINTTVIQVFIDEVKLTPPPYPVITTNTTHFFVYFEFILSTHAITIQFGLPAAEQAICELIDTVESMNLHQGIDNSLDAKLSTALDALQALNADQRNDVINKLNAFIDEVEAQRGQKITNEQADYLIARAEEIIHLMDTTI